MISLLLGDDREKATFYQFCPDYNRNRPDPTGQPTFVENAKSAIFAGCQVFSIKSAAPGSTSQSARRWILITVGSLT